MDKQESKAASQLKAENKNEVIYSFKKEDSAESRQSAEPSG